MTKNINTRRIQRRNEAASTDWSTLDANDLKSVVRDGMVAMNMTEREEFIETLEAELRREGLHMRAYLVPLGIPGRSPEDLTPTEVAHVVRFLKLNVSKAMPAIERSLGRYTSFSTNEGKNGHKIAA
jgi:hypothetical protein